jgi:hypothetical protein
MLEEEDQVEISEGRASLNIDKENHKPIIKVIPESRWSTWVRERGAPTVAPCTDDAMSWVLSPSLFKGSVSLRAAKGIIHDASRTCRLQVHLPMPNMCKLNDPARSTSARPS